MTELRDLAQTLQTLFTHEADDAARLTGFVRRASPLTGARFVQTLVFAWLQDPDASLEDLAEVAADLGADVTPQALDKRLNPQASQCLVNVRTAALPRVVTARPAALPLRQRFHGVYVFDTTTWTVGVAGGPCVSCVRCMPSCWRWWCSIGCCWCAWAAACSGVIPRRRVGFVVRRCVWRCRCRCR